MSLATTDVSKCLDKRLMIFGFEVSDLLAIFFLLSILQLFFGQARFSLALTWLPTAVVALVLRYSKRGKPESYLLHWLRFQFSPGVYKAAHNEDDLIFLKHKDRTSYERPVI